MPDRDDVPARDDGAGRGDESNHDESSSQARDDTPAGPLDAPTLEVLFAVFDRIEARVRELHE